MPDDDPDDAGRRGSAVEIPGLGPVTFDARYNEYQSMQMPVPVLGNTRYRLVVSGYDDDKAKADFHAAISAFLALGESVRKAAAVPVFEYYEDMKEAVGEDDVGVSIAGPGDVWPHVRHDDEVAIARDTDGDGQVYVWVTGECAWEPEHGLQIVFRGGRSVTRVSPCDGHLTNLASQDVNYERTS